MTKRLGIEQGSSSAEYPTVCATRCSVGSERFGLSTYRLNSRSRLLHLRPCMHGGHLVSQKGD